MSIAKCCLSVSATLGFLGLLSQVENYIFNMSGQGDCSKVALISALFIALIAAFAYIGSKIKIERPLAISLGSMVIGTVIAFVGIIDLTTNFQNVGYLRFQADMLIFMGMVIYFGPLATVTASAIDHG